MPTPIPDPNNTPGMVAARPIGVPAPTPTAAFVASPGATTQPITPTSNGYTTPSPVTPSSTVTAPTPASQGNAIQTAVYDSTGNLSGYRNNQSGVYTSVNGSTDPTGSDSSTGIDRPIYSDPNEPAAVAAQTPEEIQAEQLKASQGEIDNLNAYYKTLSDEQRVTNDANARSTNSISALNGLSGSSEAGVQAASTAKTGDAALGKIEQQRQVDVGKILSDIRTSSIAQAQQSRVEARQSVQDRQAYEEKAQTNATAQLASLSKANSGATLEGLKATLPPDQYAYLINSVGGEAQAKAILFENRPKDTLVGAPTVVGDHVVQYYQSPDGTVKSENVALPAGVAPSNIKSIEKAGDGSLVIIKNDGTWTKLTGTAKPADSSTEGTIPITNNVTGKPINVPTSVAPYVNTSSSGISYADLSSIQGTATEKKQIIDDAQKAGLKVILNKNTAADLVNIQDANSKLDSIGSIMAGIGQPSALSRDLGGLGLTNLSILAQTDPQKAAAGSLQSVGLDILKAISGVQGFRGNSTVVNQINEHMPTVYDTTAVANQKIAYIKQLISNREDSIVGKSDTSSSTTSATDADTTLMTGPDGKQYNVPNDKVDEFKAAGGH